MGLGSRPTTPCRTTSGPVDLTFLFLDLCSVPDVYHFPGWLQSKKEVGVHALATRESRTLPFLPAYRTYPGCTTKGRRAQNFSLPAVTSGSVVPTCADLERARRFSRLWASFAGRRAWRCGTPPLMSCSPARLHVPSSRYNMRRNLIVPET